MKTTTVRCLGCRTDLSLKVCESAAGFYLGHYCNSCGPHDRQTGYFPLPAQAEALLRLTVAQVETGLLCCPVCGDTDCLGDCCYVEPQERACEFCGSCHQDCADYRAMQAEDDRLDWQAYDQRMVQGEYCDPFAG